MLRAWLLISLFIPQLLMAAVPADCPGVQICFTPGQSCTQQILTALDSAQQSIWVQAYSFTSLKIAKALLAAKQRGVEVKLILDKAWLTDKNNANFNYAIEYMHKHGLPIWIDYQPRHAHNKVMILDGKQVITGSFNFTNGAEYHNAENLLIINSPPIAQQYLDNWQKRYKISKAVPSYNQIDQTDLLEFRKWLRMQEANFNKAVAN